MRPDPPRRKWEAFFTAPGHQNQRKLRAYEHFDIWLRWMVESKQGYRPSQREMGLRAGIDHSTISRLLTSDRVPSLETARALIDAWVD